MQDKSIKILIICLIILGVFLGAYEGLWRQGAKKVINYNIKFTQEIEDIYLVLIWDASESMWEKDFDIEKIIQSKDVLETFVNEIPDNINIGLRIFGARRINDLEDSFLAAPIQNNNKNKLLNFITNVEPLGRASIAYTLEESRKDLQNVQGKKYLLLVSDGIDYGQIPTEDVIERLIEDDITLHIVHIGESEQCIKEKLKDMANNTGGEYFLYNDKDRVIKTFANYHQ
ncbi:MAG: vWA domain-containing protein [Candidatus Woesearchaeota archaeon]